MLIHGLHSSHTPVTVPWSASPAHRLKLLQGTQFIYLLRGLPRVLVLDQPARAVGWGALQLVFATTQQLECFLAVLRHVSVS